MTTGVSATDSPPVPPGTVVTTTAGGAPIVITRRADPGGVFVRTTVVPPLAEVEPFELRLLE